MTKNSEYEAEVRRHASELVAQAIRCTEDRVAEVKRKAGTCGFNIQNNGVQELILRYRLVLCKAVGFNTFVYLLQVYSKKLVT